MVPGTVEGRVEKDPFVIEVRKVQYVKSSRWFAQPCSNHPGIGDLGAIDDSQRKVAELRSEDRHVPHHNR